jgi:hypothetical protein
VQYNAEVFPVSGPAGYTAYTMSDAQFATYGGDAASIELVSISDDQSGIATSIAGVPTWLIAQTGINDFLDSDESSYGVSLDGDLLISSYTNAGVDTPVVFVRNTTPLNMNMFYFLMRNSDDSNQSFALFNKPIAPTVETVQALRVVEKDCESGTLSQTFVDSTGAVVAPPSESENLLFVLNDVRSLLENQPTVLPQVETGQPSLRLPAGTYTKDGILNRLNTEGYNTFVNPGAGQSGIYGLNSVVLAPSATFDLSVAGLTSQTYDYPVSMEAGGNEYLMQDVDNFTVVVPSGQTLDVHMVVWLISSVSM